MTLAPRAPDWDIGDDVSWSWSWLSGKPNGGEVAKTAASERTNWVVASAGRWTDCRGVDHKYKETRSRDLGEKKNL